MYSPYERPPYPILIENPTFRNLLQNLRFSDFVMGGTIYGVGVLWAYYASRAFVELSHKLLIYHGLSHLFFVTAGCAMMIVSFRRITGYWDNGLRWRKPEDRLRKYDNTSHFEAATIWGRIRPPRD